MAKEIAKKEDWRTFVEATDTLYYEETMLQGMVIGRAKMEPEERIKYIRLFVQRINNWAVCDIFSGELKTAARKGKETIWQFVQPYLESKEEYQLRFIAGICRPIYTRGLLCTYGNGMDDIHLLH